MLLIPPPALGLFAWPIRYDLPLQKVRKGIVVTHTIPHTDESALLASILAMPLEDTPRLAYADCLDETAGMVDCARDGCRGGVLVDGRDTRQCVSCGGSGRVSDGRAERAAYIRNTVANPVHLNLPPGSSASVDAFTGGRIEIAPAIPGVAYAVSRGFVSAISCDTATFLRVAKAVFACQPVVSVTLTDKRPADRQSVNQRHYWFLDEGRHAARGNDLPMAIFRRVCDIDAETVFGMPFFTESAALLALSAACVAHGRAEAGLPKLEGVMG